jgi:Winged helix DNA-binding domain
MSAGGGIVRMWAMRGTLHLVAAEDVALVLAIFGPLLLARGQRRLTQLGLPPDVAERSTAATAAILAEAGPLTRHELAARLRERGVPVEAKGQAPIHVVAHAAHAGVLREVGVRGREELYGPLEPGPLPDRGDALAELGRRYAAAHAPATKDDFAVWSGLPAADVRRAWVEPEPPAGDAPEGPVRLLPAFDEWLLGWASRDLAVPSAHARRVAPGGGIIRPVAIADGRAFATWRLDRRARRVELDAFRRLSRATRAGVEAEVEALGAFLGLDLDLAL